MRALSLFNTLRRHPFISGSAIIFAGSFFINGFNYLFNLIMGRILPVEDYGLLVALVAIITIVTVFQTSLANLFARFSARYTAQKRDDLKSSLFYNGLKITGILGIVVLCLLLLFAIPIASFLHLNNPYVIGVVFLCISVSILLSLPMGILQGELKFMRISILNIFGMGAKIAVGVLLVFLGYGVAGALFGVFLAYIIPYAISMLSIKALKGKSNNKSHIDFYNEFKKVSIPFLLASSGVIIFQSTDVIFARHFLSSENSGQFAALSLMGKAIFYVTAPLYFAFFPVITHKREANQGTMGTLLLALGLILLCSLFFSLIYIFFPQFVLSVFFPQSSYAVLQGVLGLYSLYILIFSLAFLIHTYLLSIGKTGVYKPSLISAFTYIILILFFHSSILEITYVLIFSSFLLLISLLVYYRKHERT